MRTRMWIAGLLLIIISVVSAAAQEEGDKDEFAGRTPPRLGFVNGQVSFWRPGAEDWVQAQVNTALSPGDELYTGSPGTMELQIGPRAFARGWANTQIGLVNQDPDYIQFKVTAGYASFDLRTLEPGHTVEVDTPNGAFTIEHTGFYRVDVAGERTAFISRRGGQAVLTPAGGEPMAIAPNEEVVLTGTDHPEAASFAAPALDSWDRWNYARTEELLDSVSSRYVPSGTYGIDDLDYYGRWRVVPDYGPVWIPTGTPAGWAPYSTGAWVQDPYYGWTWVDTAPWGWAPYHYGRWVHVNGYWGWTPGPAVARPVYSPACVAFFGGPHGSVSIGIGGPVFGWVALGWGEPIVPWWGHPGHGPRPWWGGWGGPRVVNNVVVNRTTVVNVNQINVYRNAEVHNAVVAVRGDRFGHGPVQSTRITQVNSREFSPLHGAPQVQASAASFVPTDRRGARPPEQNLHRAVVATRAPERPTQESASPGRANPAVAPRAETRLVPAPDKNQAGGLSRAPFGQGGRERGPDQAVERSLPPGAAGRTADMRTGTGTPAVQTPAAVTRTPDAARRAPEPSPPTANRPTGQATADTPAPQHQGGAVPPGQSSGERGPKIIENGSPRPAQAPAPRTAGQQATSIPSPSRPQVAAPSAPSQSSQRRPDTAGSQVRTLPGEPATRVAPNRVDTGGTRTERHAAPPVPQTRAPQAVQGSGHGSGGGPAHAVQQNSARPAPQEPGRGNPGTGRPGTGPGRVPETGRPGQVQ